MAKGANPNKLLLESHAPCYKTPLKSARSKVKEYEKENDQEKLATAKEILKTLNKLSN